MRSVLSVFLLYDCAIPLGSLGRGFAADAVVGRESLSALPAARSALFRDGFCRCAVRGVCAGRHRPQRDDGSVGSKGEKVKKTSMAPRHGWRRVATLSATVLAVFGGVLVVFGSVQAVTNVASADPTSLGTHACFIRVQRIQQ